MLAYGLVKREKARGPGLNFTFFSYRKCSVFPTSLFLSEIFLDHLG